MTKELTIDETITALKRWAVGIKRDGLVAPQSTPQLAELLEHPLCKYCAERDIVTPAEICDHVEPHHGDINKFWLGPFQSLCKSCHDSTKRFVETRGFRPDIGLDGRPLEAYSLRR